MPSRTLSDLNADVSSKFWGVISKLQCAAAGVLDRIFQSPSTTFNRRRSLMYHWSRGQQKVRRASERQDDDFCATRLVWTTCTRASLALVNLDRCGVPIELIGVASKKGVNNSNLPPSLVPCDELLSSFGAADLARADPPCALFYFYAHPDIQTG